MNWTEWMLATGTCSRFVLRIVRTHIRVTWSLKTFQAFECIFHWRRRYHERMKIHLRFFSQTFLIVRFAHGTHTRANRKNTHTHTSLCSNRHEVQMPFSFDIFYFFFCSILAQLIRRPQAYWAYVPFFPCVRLIHCDVASRHMYHGTCIRKYINDKRECIIRLRYITIDSKWAQIFIICVWHR